jgi:hypothetical protein
MPLQDIVDPVDLLALEELLAEDPSYMIELYTDWETWGQLPDWWKHQHRDLILKVVLEDSQYAECGVIYFAKTGEFDLSSHMKFGEFSVVNDPVVNPRAIWSSALGGPYDPEDEESKYYEQLRQAAERKVF